MEHFSPPRPLHYGHAAGSRTRHRRPAVWTFPAAAAVWIGNAGVGLGNNAGVGLDGAPWLWRVGAHLAIRRLRVQWFPFPSHRQWRNDGRLGPDDGAGRGRGGVSVLPARGLHLPAARQDLHARRAARTPAAEPAWDPAASPGCASLLRVREPAAVAISHPPAATGDPPARRRDPGRGLGNAVCRPPCRNAQ